MARTDVALQLFCFVVVVFVPVILQCFFFSARAQEIERGGCRTEAAKIWEGIG